MRAARPAVVAVALCAGLAAESIAFDWDEPLRWLPDLVVGLAFVGLAVDAWPRSRGTAWLAAAVGAAWFAGTVLPAAIFWHRGFLVHLLLAYPYVRPPSRASTVAVAAGYLAAAVPAVWRNEGASIVLAVALAAAAVWTYRGSAGRRWRDRRVALFATMGLAVVVAGGAVARLVVPDGDAAIPTLLVYEAALCGICVVLAAGLRGPAVARVTDLVVELGDQRSGTLRDALARTLGDPDLEVGYWQPGLGGYVDAHGRPVAVPASGEQRSATTVDHDRRPFALIVHDSALLGDDALVDAVAAATVLTAANAELQAAVQARVDDVTASRRRLLVAADEERERLEERLRDGVGARLERLSEALEAATGPQPSPHLRAAAGRLRSTRDELRELARGLHPRELDHGLAAALAAVAGRSTVPVHVTAPDERYPHELELVIYYTCTEALTNVAKHAAASAVTIDVARRGDELVAVVADDGVGGADPARGSGIRGLVDRVEAVGGSLRIESPGGGGTRLVTAVPLDRIL